MDKRTEMYVDKKAMYENPTISILLVSAEDILTVSGFIDENLGEWDIQ